MIGLVIIVGIYTIYLMNEKYNEHKRKLNELERRLDEYYTRMENRINKESNKE